MKLDTYLERAAHEDDADAELDLDATQRELDFGGFGGYESDGSLATRGGPELSGYDSDGSYGSFSALSISSITSAPRAQLGHERGCGRRPRRARGGRPRAACSARRRLRRPRRRRVARGWRRRGRARSPRRLTRLTTSTACSSCASARCSARSSCARRPPRSRRSNPRYPRTSPICFRSSRARRSSSRAHARADAAEGEHDGGTRADVETGVSHAFDEVADESAAATVVAAGDNDSWEEMETHAELEPAAVVAWTARGSRRRRGASSRATARFREPVDADGRAAAAACVVAWAQPLAAGLRADGLDDNGSLSPERPLRGRCARASSRRSPSLPRARAARAAEALAADDARSRGCFSRSRAPRSRPRAPRARTTTRATMMAARSRFASAVAASMRAMTMRSSSARPRPTATSVRRPFRRTAARSQPCSTC